MSTEERHIERRPNLSVLALISFAGSFAIARIFTALNTNFALKPSGYHIHHFWFGILMLAIGGWLGISYNDSRIDRIAAIVFGAGGGLIGDEVGILLTLREGQGYWAGISYTFMIILLAVASILVLFNKYSKVIAKEFAVFSGSRGGLYFAIFLEAVSIAFLIDTENPVIIAVTSVLAAIAFLTILSFFVQTIKSRLRRRLGSGRDAS